MKVFSTVLRWALTGWLLVQVYQHAHWSVTTFCVLVTVFCEVAGWGLGELLASMKLLMEIEKERSGGKP